MIKIYIDTPKYCVRPKNTDWQYVRSLVEMERFIDIKTFYSQKMDLILEENWRWLKAKIGEKIGYKPKPDYSRVLSDSKFNKENLDLIYSHGKFPISIYKKPVAWMHGVVDPAMRMANGQSYSDIEAEYNALEPLFKESSAVLMPSKSMVKRHADKFRYLSERFVYAPFFLPHLKSTPLTEIELKHANANDIHVLFVGRDGERKGLRHLLTAIEKIPSKYINRFKFDVVTSRQSYEQYVSETNRVNWHIELNRNEVQCLMKEAHVFVMPSNFESYGIVYLEAMAAGAVVIAPNFESQSDILENGSLGLLIKPCAEDILTALNELIDQGARVNFAKMAVNKFNNEYSPEAAAKIHYDIFRSMLAM